LGLLVVLVAALPFHNTPLSVWALLAECEKINLSIFLSSNAILSSAPFAVTSTT
jgi:hypothetical protein